MDNIIKKHLGSIVTSVIVTLIVIALFFSGKGDLAGGTTYRAYQGGTDNSTYNEGDILVASRSGSTFELVRLASGSAGNFLGVVTTGHPGLGWTSSTSRPFEISNTVSASFGGFDAGVFGSHTASSSSAYQIQVGPGGTATASFLFAGKGCIQMQNTAGGNVYLRVVGTTLTINSTKCR